MKRSGKILVLAYPDTFVRMSDEWQCKVLPKLGLGTEEFIKAGHAAMVLIDDQTGAASYYDFGRYVTPDGKGRVRSAYTDQELVLPFKAHIRQGQIQNLDDFLVWLSSNPKKTHGEGRLIASVCDHIDFDSAASFAKGLQKQGSIRYGAFAKDGSNCARFVTDTIVHATFDRKILFNLKKNKLFTPSAIGNVEKAATSEIYQANEGKIEPYAGSAFQENLQNYFDKDVPSPMMEEKEVSLPKTAQLLTGIGSNAYFTLEVYQKEFLITRYNHWKEKDFAGVFTTQEEMFDPNAAYQFTYDSHCAHCHVIQQGKIIRLDRLQGRQTTDASSAQKAHTA